MAVLITGGPTAEETHYGQAIKALSSAPVTNLVGQTGLKELFAILGRATAVLAPDSGPVHMAVAAGTPVLGLYATSNPRRTGPALGQRWVINAYPDAVRRAFGVAEADIPWGRRVRDPAAMELITVAAVTDRLDALLATPPAQRLSD
jgi:heptosyltransferase I